LSFRTKREIFPRSLAFARDDRPWACRLASLRLRSGHAWRSFDQAQDMLGGSNIRIREFSTSGKFARAAQILSYSSTEFAEFGVFFNQNLFTPRPPRLRGAISESGFTRKPEEPANLTVRRESKAHESAVLVPTLLANPASALCRRPRCAAAPGAARFALFPVSPGVCRKTLRHRPPVRPSQVR